MTADYLITSTNAITLDGKLVNLDGQGPAPPSVGRSRWITEPDREIMRLCPWK